MRPLRQCWFRLEPIGLMLLLTTVPAAAQDAVPSGESKPDIMQRWRELRQAGKHREALAEADRLVTARPKLSIPIFMRGFSHGDLEEWDKSVADLTDALRLGHDKAEIYCVRGWAHSRREDWKAAIADYTAALTADSKDARIRVQRAYAYRRAGKAGDAREDLDRAIADNPQLAEAYAQRGHLAQYALGDPALAKSDYRKVTELRPTNATDLQALAWLLATCVDEKIRDGAAAVAIAQKACELTGWKKARHLDALAAAYAETERFDAAADYATKAVELAEPRDKASISERLELYKVGKPYRE